MLPSLNVSERSSSEASSLPMVTDDCTDAQIAISVTVVKREMSVEDLRKNILSSWGNVAESVSPRLARTPDIYHGH